MTSVHLTNAFHETSGGIRTAYLALLQQAEQEGRRVVLVVPGVTSGVERVGRCGTIYRVRAPRAPAFDRRYRVILPHRFLRPGVGPLWKILREERPEIVEVADKYSLCYLAGLLRRQRRTPGDGPTLIGSTCERLDDTLTAYVGGGSVGAAAARAYLGRIYIGMFDAHIANSMYTARELQAGMRPPHVRRVHVAPPGVDAVPEVSSIRRHAARVRLRAQFGITLTAPLLVYAGRLAPEKNVTILPEIISRVRQRIAEAQLLVVGDGPSRGAIERAARVAAGAVHLHPHISGRDALFAMLAAADLFVHPNGREPFGIGPLEAMASGIPVVLPNSGGLTTYATEQNAWMARADASGLASAAVAALVNDPERE